jgi:signal transduction histidine kinase
MAFDASPGLRRGELLGLFIERVCSDFEVYVNGELVYRGGDLAGPRMRNCQYPVLVALPGALIKPEANLLDLRVVGHPLSQVASHERAGGLSALQLGPYGQMADRLARYTAWKVTLPQVVSGTLLLMGGFIFVLGWRNRQASYLAYFGALSVGWAALTARLWLRELRVPQTELLVCGLAPFIVLCAVQFLLRYAGRRQPLLTMALVAQCVLVPMTAIAAGNQMIFTVASFWYVLLGAETVAASLYYLRLTKVEQPGEFLPMAGMLGLAGILALLEFASQQRGFGGLHAEVSHIAMPLTLIAIGLRLVQHFGGALRESEESRATLEARIREATAEIERNFAQLAELRVEQVTERERKRIAADLHDDLGAKLLTIVHTSDSERISTLAREALEEMRLSVRGLTGKPVRLIDALGDWRAEVVSRLAQAGIEADWNAPVEEMPHTLSARAYVQTTRILREAVSNIIKHSGASHCAVGCHIEQGDFQLVVQDNGKGIPMELDGRMDRGHGMSSMKHRAKQLQGQCLVESGPGYGTVIRLTLPL